MAAPETHRLQHDREGFLVGKPLATHDDKATDLLGAIKGDTAKILSAIRAMPRLAQTQPAVRPLRRTQSTSNDSSASAARRSNAPQPRDAQGRFTTVPVSAQTQSVRRPGAREGSSQQRNGAEGQPQQPGRARADATAATALASVARTVASERRERRASEAQQALQRGTDGRFTRGDSAGEKSKGTGLSGAAGAAISAAGSALSGADQVDPAIAAANEIRGMAAATLDTVAPLGRGLGRMFGRDERKEEREQTGWLKRLWREMRGLRADEAASKPPRARKEGASGGDGGSGILSMIMAMLSPLMSLGGLLPKLLGGAGGMLGGVARGAGGLMKRVPMLSALLSGFEGFMSDRDIANDPNLSPEERRSKRIANGTKTAGALAGTAVGAAIGTAVFPGVGTALGSMVGAWLGGEGGEMLAKPFEAVLDWFEGLDLKASWDAAMNGISDAWNGVTSKLSGWISSLPGADLVKSGVEKVKAAAAPVVDAVSSKASSAWGAAKEAAAPAVDAVSKKASAAWGAAKEAAAPVVESIKQSAPVAGASRLIDLAGQAKNWVLGKTSSKYESGNRGAAAVSSGKGDLGGASYGTYQLASKTGTLQQFLKDSPYGKQFEGLQPGTEAFNKKWKEVAGSDPAFGQAQHDFIEKTHYAPQMEKLAKSGIDLSGRGAAVKDAVWSTSVQFGGKSSLIEKALAGKDVKSMSDADIASAIQDYKIANNDKLFASSSADVRAGTFNRAKKEKGDLLAMAAQPPAAAAGGVPLTPAPEAAAAARSLAPAMPAATAPAAIARMPAPVAAPAPITVTPVAEVRPPPAQLNSASPPAQPAQAAQPPGQDVSERRIAHLVTGGISGPALRR